jgi:type VI secretion system Hcp family effector
MFDILSFRHGLARSADGGGPVFGDLAFAKRVNRSSPKLAEAVARGRVFPKVKIELTAAYGDAGLLPYLRYELSNVRVTSHQIMGGHGENTDGDAIQSRFWGSETVNELAESVRINFEEIKVTYTEYDEVGVPKSDIEFGWKVEEGEP